MIILNFTHMGHIIKLTRNRYFSVFPSKALPVPCHPSFMLSLETQHWSRLWPRGCLGVFVFSSLLPGSVDLRVKNIKVLLVTFLQLQKYPESSHTAILRGELCLIQWHCNLTHFFISRVFKIKLQGHIAFQCFPNKFFYTIFLKLLFMLTDCMLSGINTTQPVNPVQLLFFWIFSVLQPFLQEHIYTFFNNCYLPL